MYFICFSIAIFGFQISNLVIFWPISHSISRQIAAVTAFYYNTGEFLNECTDEFTTFDGQEYIQQVQQASIHYKVITVLMAIVVFINFSCGCGFALLMMSVENCINLKDLYGQMTLFFNFYMIFN